MMEPSYQITLPTTLRAARVCHAGGREGRSLHLAVVSTLHHGHLRRLAGDPLCRPADRFPHLNIYEITRASIAELCPQCLLAAVRVGMVPRSVVSAAEAAYAANRLSPSPSGGSPIVADPGALWQHLPQWSAVPVIERNDDPTLTVQSRQIIRVKQRVSQVEPMRSTMTPGWFYDRAMSASSSGIHVNPIALRVPAPNVVSDRITLLTLDKDRVISGRPIARLGNDLVVTISPFEVLLLLHDPKNFPGGVAAYRAMLSTWHRFALSERIRLERRAWRNERTRHLCGLGFDERQIAAWMFESPAYIHDLLSTPTAVK